MRVKAVKLLLLGSLFGFGFVNVVQAVAEEAKATAATADKSDKEKKKTKIDFEDELIEGELKKPELFYLLQKKQFNFKRLIKLREDFMPEMRRDGNEMRRGRGKI